MRCSSATVTRVRAEFAADDVTVAILTLARVDGGDDDAVHEVLLDVARGDLGALKRATWVAVRDWRNLMMASALSRTVREVAPVPVVIAAVVATFAWADWADADGDEALLEVDDRAVTVSLERGAEPLRVVYLGFDGNVPEEETFAEHASLIEPVTRWLRDADHRDFGD